MASTNGRTRGVLQAAVTLMMGGVQNDLPTGTKNIPVDGTQMTPTTIVTQLQSWLTSTADLATAKAAYQKAVADNRSQTTAVRALMKALTIWLKSQFGSTNIEALAKFGIVVTLPKPQSTASKSLAVTKRANTAAAKKAAAKAASDAVNPPQAYLVTEAGVQLAPTATSNPVVPAPTGTVGK